MVSIADVSSMVCFFALRRRPVMKSTVTIAPADGHI